MFSHLLLFLAKFTWYGVRQLKLLFVIAAVFTHKSVNAASAEVPDV